MRSPSGLAFEQVRRAVVRCRRGVEEYQGTEIEPARRWPQLTIAAGVHVDELAAAHAEAAVREVVVPTAAGSSELEEIAAQAMTGAIAGARQIGADTVRVAQRAARGALLGAWQAGGNVLRMANAVMAGTIEAARDHGLKPADLASATASALVDAAEEIDDEAAARLVRALSRTIEGVAVAVRGPRQVPLQLREP
jgi:hypothetical protein